MLIMFYDPYSVRAVVAERNRECFALSSAQEALQADATSAQEVGALIRSLLDGLPTAEVGMQRVCDDPISRLHTWSATGQRVALFAHVGGLWIFGGMFPSGMPHLGTSIRFAANTQSGKADFITYGELRNGFTQLLGSTDWTAQTLHEYGIPLNVGLTLLVGRVSAPRLMDGRNPDLCAALDLLEISPAEAAERGGGRAEEDRLIELVRSDPNNFVRLEGAHSVCPSPRTKFTAAEVAPSHPVTSTRNTVEALGVDPVLIRRFKAEHARSGSLTVDRVLGLCERRGLDEPAAAAVRAELERLGLLPKVRAAGVEGWTPPRDDDDSPFIPDLLGQYLREIGAHQLLMPEDEVKLGRRMRAARELLNAKGCRNDAALRDFLVGYVDTAELAPHERRIVSEGAAAEERMFVCNLRLVVSVARKTSWHHNRLDPLDIVQAGNVGLSRAIQKFDERKGFKFSTYATWWIRQAIQRHVADAGRIIRLPVHVHDQIKAMHTARRTLEFDFGRSPTLDELASYMGLDPAEVQALDDWSSTTASLDAPLGQGSSETIGSLVVDPSTINSQEEAIDRAATKALIGDSLACLSERESEVLRLRFGFYDDRPRTLEDVGKFFGLTRERIRQIEKKGLKKMRQQLGKDELEDLRW